MSDQQITADFAFENLIYASDSMNGVIERCRRIAPSDASVLITGEAGVGKTHIAKALHYNSPRKKKPFVLIASSLTEQQVETELFGQAEGSASDAAF
jgi:two-component system response regulator HydG